MPSHIGDYGTEIQFQFTKTEVNPVTLLAVTSVLNIASASEKKCKIQAPGSDPFEKTLSFITDGADGLAKCVILNGEFPDGKAGNWKAQAWVILPSGRWSGDIVTFPVKAVL